MSRVSYGQKNWDDRRRAAIVRLEQNVTDYTKQVSDLQRSAKGKPEDSREVKSLKAWEDKLSKAHKTLENTQSNLGRGSASLSKVETPPPQLDA